MGTYTVTNIEPYGNDERITVYWVPGRFAALVGSKAIIKQYVGEGTVWYEYPSGKRCPTMTESLLSNLVMRYKFKNEPPTLLVE